MRYRLRATAFLVAAFLVAVATSCETPASAQPGPGPAGKGMGPPKAAPRLRPALPPKVAPPAATRPSPVERLKGLAQARVSPWEQLARGAVDLAVDLFSGNEPHLLSENSAELLSRIKTELLSGNETELLSGNSPKLLSENSPTLLSGNKPEILSGNKTTVLSGNRISIFSGIKVEFHVRDSGNHNGNHGLGGPPQGPQGPGPSHGPGPGMPQMGPQGPQGPGPSHGPGPGPGMAPQGPHGPQGPGQPCSHEQSGQGPCRVREAVKHMHEAASSLQAAGMGEIAERLRREASKLDHEAHSGGGPQPPAPHAAPGAPR